MKTFDFPCRWLLFLLFLAGVMLAAHLGVQKAATSAGLERRLAALPDKNVLLLATLDGRELAADCLWLTADRRRLNSLSSGELVAGKSRAFYLFDAITTLDPYFYVVYLYAATFLPGPQYLRDLEGGRIILERAMARFPDQWIFPFFLGSAYYDTAGDEETAARYFTRALHTGSPPTFLVDLVGLIYRRGRGRELPASWYRQLREQCRDETLRAYLDRLLAARAGRRP